MLFLEVVARMCSVMKVFLKTLPEACNFVKKKTLTQVFSFVFCKFLRIPIPIENLW